MGVAFSTGVTNLFAIAAVLLLVGIFPYSRDFLTSTGSREFLQGFCYL